MKVKKLIDLLKKENQNSEVIAYLGAKNGWEMVELGMNDAILGKKRTGKDDFVLIPVEIPDKLQPWAKAEGESGEIDNTDCCICFKEITGDEIEYNNEGDPFCTQCYKQERINNENQ